MVGVTRRTWDDELTFVVRMWLERSRREPGAQEWRGTIRRVSDGEVVFFRHVDGIVEAIEELRRRPIGEGTDPKD